MAVFSLILVARRLGDTPSWLLPIGKLMLVAGVILSALMLATGGALLALPQWQGHGMMLR